MLAGVKPKGLREGNLSGITEVKLSQSGIGGKNPEKLWKTFPRGKALGNDPICLGLGGVDGIPFLMPHLYKFGGFTFTKIFRHLMVEELHWSIPGRILSQGKRGGSQLLWRRGATWAAGHKQHVSPRDCDQGCVSAARRDKRACQLCYLGSFLGENLSLEEVRCLISTQAALNAIYGFFYISQIYREEQSENCWRIKDNSY